MPRYRYTASNSKGQKINGVYDANTERDVIFMLRTKSYYPLEVSEIKTTLANKEILLFPKISVKYLCIFCQQFASILRAGVPMTKGLEIMASQCEDKSLAKIIQDVYEKVQTGRSLSDSFKDHPNRFPDIFFSMIDAGEMSGTLETSFERMGVSFKKDHALNQKMKNAMIYPAAVGIVAIVVVWYLLTNVVPTFESIFANSGADLPIPTKILMNLSDFVGENTPIILGVVLVIVIIIRMILKSRGGKYAFDRLKLRLPILGKLNIKVLASRFTRTLSTLFASGVPLTSALDITAAAMTNSFAERGLLEVAEKVKQGRPLSDTLEALAVFPPMVTHMTRIGEESGMLEDLLEKTSDYYDDEADSAVTKMMSMLEPAIIVVLGGAVMFIVMAILLPMFGMMEYI